MPRDIPGNPNRTYLHEGWSGTGDWLGSGVVATNIRKYRSFKDARTFAQNLNFEISAQWWTYTKSANFPEDIPASPNRVYKDKGWSGMGDWLGTGNLAPSFRKFKDFEDAREFARSLNMEVGKEWV
jgi:hypothetical protein